MIDVSEVVNDPDLAQAFTITRSQGKWVKGNWVDDPYDLPSYGTVQPASQREIEMVPEGDRIVGVVAVWSTEPLYASSTTAMNDPNARTSDIVTWQGQKFRVRAINPWDVTGGYHKAVATRMAGE